MHGTIKTVNTLFVATTLPLLTCRALSMLSELSCLVLRRRTRAPPCRPRWRLTLLLASDADAGPSARHVFHIPTKMNRMRQTATPPPPRAMCARMNRRQLYELSIESPPRARLSHRTLSQNAPHPTFSQRTMPVERQTTNLARSIGQS